MIVLGKTYLTLKLVGNGKERVVRLIVDTGSVFTWIRREILEELGVKPRGKQVFITIEGRKIVREIGGVEAEFDSLRMPIPVVFAEQNDKEVLGVTALEIFGLIVDPRTGEIRKEDALFAL